jgi:hypothetical protein
VKFEKRKLLITALCVISVAGIARFTMGQAAPCDGMRAGAPGDCAVATKCDQFLQQGVCTSQTGPVQPRSTTCVAHDGTNCVVKSQLCYTECSCIWITPQVGSAHCKHDAPLQEVGGLFKGTEPCETE